MPCALSALIGQNLATSICHVMKSKFTETLAFVAYLINFVSCFVSLFSLHLLLQLFRPSAAGSGIPELIGFLNGTFVHHIFNIKTMVAKFLSCALAVSAGLPAGPEGPVIHMG